LMGKRRFSEFQRSLGLAKNILCARLQKLVAHGIFKIGPASDGCAYQEYTLTEKGRGLYIVLVALRQWGESCLFEKGELDLLLVDRETGKPIKPLELRSQDGRLLGSTDLGTVSRAVDGGKRRRETKHRKATESVAPDRAVH
jgi:DNA-binding HxlR family transcriptional regulator